MSIRLCSISVCQVKEDLEVNYWRDMADHLIWQVTPLPSHRPMKTQLPLLRQVVSVCELRSRSGYGGLRRFGCSSARQEPDAWRWVTPVIDYCYYNTPKNSNNYFILQRMVQRVTTAMALSPWEVRHEQSVYWLPITGGKSKCCLLLFVYPVYLGYAGGYGSAGLGLVHPYGNKGIKGPKQGRTVKQK